MISCRTVALATAISGTLFVPVVTSLAGSSAPCQVSGTVLDVDGKAVSGASVTAYPDKLTDTTDVKGGFCMNGLQAGRQMLLAHHPEAGDTRKVVTLESGADPLQVSLTLSDSFRDEVVVTATRTEQRLEDVPVRVQLVPKEAV